MWFGMARFVWEWFELVWYGLAGLVRFVILWCVRVWLCAVRLGLAGGARFGRLGHDRVCLGLAGAASRGKSGLGEARLGMVSVNNQKRRKLWSTNTNGAVLNMLFRLKW